MQVLSVTHCCMDSQLHTQHYNCLLSDLTLQCALKIAQQRTIIQQYGTLVHWLLMGGLLHLVQRGGVWAGCGPAQTPLKPLKPM